jgi:hypothetical protein
MIAEDLEDLTNEFNDVALGCGGYHKTVIPLFLSRFTLVLNLRIEGKHSFHWARSMNVTRTPFLIILAGLRNIPTRDPLRYTKHNKYPRPSLFGAWLLSFLARISCGRGLRISAMMLRVIPSRILIRRRSGQAMLVAVLALGGAVLGATTIAGFLMSYQIRASSDSANSAKAAFAADSGVEAVLYQHNRHLPTDPLGFGNSASAEFSCTDDSGNPIDCCEAAATTAIAKGSAAGASRAFQATFPPSYDAPGQGVVNLNPSTVEPGGQYTMSCDWGVANTYVPAPPNCMPTGQSGTAATFSCSAPGALGTYTVSCQPQNVADCQGYAAFDSIPAAASTTLTVGDSKSGNDTPPTPSASCEGPGTTAIISWGLIDGADYYSVWVYDQFGTEVYNKVIHGDNTTFSTTPGYRYAYYVNLHKDGTWFRGDRNSFSCF